MGLCIEFNICSKRWKDYIKYIEYLTSKGINSEYDIFDDNKGNFNLIERQK